MYKKWMPVFAKAIFFTMVLLLWLNGLRSAFRQQIYRESYDIAVTNGYYCIVNDPDQKIEQEFEAPCDDPKASISVQIGTFMGESRSRWRAELYEAGTGDRIYEGTFDAKDIKDNLYYKVIDRSAEVQKGRKYTLVITPLVLKNELGLAFYGDDTGTQGHMAGTEEKVAFNLALKVLGGSDSRNGFWAGCYIAVSLFVLLLFVRIRILQKKQIPWTKDRIVQTMVLMLVYFFLQQGALDIHPFMDENDNIRGGMVIAEGGVVYRDYITQHMPLAYYLCALFSLAGAGSAPQFRLLYYMFCAAAAGFIYMRNGEKFGKCRVVLFLLVHPLVLCMFH